jgi:hypothetical protein
MDEQGYKKIIKWGVIVSFCIILVYLYKTYNPINSNYFPKCPFRELTGYRCPGCGSQRAIHYLLNFDLRNAIKENLLLVIFIPYIMIGLAFDMIKLENSKLLIWRKRLFGTKAIIVVLILIILFWILRNTIYFGRYI